MSSTEPAPARLELTGAVYLLRPTRARAPHLEALRAGIAEATPDVLFYHTQMPRMREPDAADTPVDDFSAWVRGVLQDVETAERLAFAALSAPSDAETLRAGLLRVLDQVPHDRRMRLDAPPGGEFVFLTADIVRLPTEIVVGDPAAAFAALAQANVAIWFHHVVEAAWLDGRGERLSTWLEHQGCARIAAVVAREASSGRPIAQTRRTVLREWRRGRLGRRMLEAERDTADARRNAGREAVASLARRLARREDER